MAMFAVARLTGIERHGCIPLLILAILLICFFPSSVVASDKPEILKGVYFPSSILQGRSFDGIVHYMEAAGLNLAVLHVKDPMGRLYWRTENSLAVTHYKFNPN